MSILHLMVFRDLQLQQGLFDTPRFTFACFLNSKLGVGYNICCRMFQYAQIWHLRIFLPHIFLTKSFIKNIFFKPICRTKSHLDSVQMRHVFIPFYPVNRFYSTETEESWCSKSLYLRRSCKNAIFVNIISNLRKLDIIHAQHSTNELDTTNQYFMCKISLGMFFFSCRRISKIVNLIILQIKFETYT